MKGSNWLWVINFRDEYRKSPQRVGVNHKLFKINNYYTSDLYEDKYWLEKTFSREIENYYPNIINEVEAEANLSENVRHNLLMWIYTSEMRTPIRRLNMARIADKLLRIESQYKRDGKYEEQQDQIASYIEQLTKNHHILSFHDEKILRLFAEVLINKAWTIFKAPVGKKFWTNDNPGFSPNLHPVFQKDRPYHMQFELNEMSVCYFVLSSKYCIQFTPFMRHEDPAVDGMNMEIQYIVANDFIYAHVMRGVFYTKNRLMIAPTKDLLGENIKFTT